MERKITSEIPPLRRPTESDWKPPVALGRWSPARFQIRSGGKPPVLLVQTRAR